MAVVSISRIQIRRGKKNSDTGVPQLASGEFGWAVDAQELYIGNGSVAEGAPYVGNTQILTENSNIFDLAGSYTYGTESGLIQTGPSENNPIQRTLKQRLDDRVSVRAFGANADGSVQTAALQRAIDQIFLNSATKTNPASRVVLHMEPGTYLIDSTIFLPPHVTLVGAGQDKTVITSTTTGPVFRTVNSESVPGAPADDSITTTENQATNLHISGMTINVPDEQSAFYFVNCKNSVFRDLTIQSNWSSGTGTWENSYAFRLDSLSTAVTCSNNTFENIRVSGFYRIAQSDWDIKNNTWTNCNFSRSRYGFVFGENTTIGNIGQETGPTHNTIEHSVFDLIDQHCVWVAQGSYNLSKNNSYHSVGYDGGSLSNVGNVVSVLQYDAENNRSEDDWFERSQLYGNDPRYFDIIPYITEVAGSVDFQNKTQQVLQTVGGSGPHDLFRVPLSGDRNFTINYVFSSDVVNAVRSGKMQITVDTQTQQVIINDEYNFVGDSQYQDMLDFTATVSDLDYDATAETVLVRYANSVANDTGTFKYTFGYN